MFDKTVFKLIGAGRTAVLLALLSLAGALASVGQAWALCCALVALWGGAGLAGREGLLVVFAGCYLGNRVIRAVREWLLTRFAAARAGEMRRQALERLMAGRVRGEDAGLGAAGGTSLVIEGAEQVERYLELSLGKSIDLAVIPLVIIVAVFALDWVSGIIALVAFPFIMLYMVMIGGNARELAEQRQLEQARLSNHFLDAMRGLDVLRAFGRARGHAEAIYRVSERLRGATMRTLRTATLSSAVLDLFATFALAGVAVMLGFRLVDGDMMLFPALMALVLVPEFFLPVRSFAADYHATLDGKHALERMRALLEAPERSVAVLPEAAWGDGSELAIRGLTVRYGDACALEDVSFAVRGFERVGIVGASGAGKSTLASVLAGFLDPCAGAFELRAGESEARAASLYAPAWQRQVIYIPQKPYLFHATVAENIAFYTPDAPRERIERAAEAMGLAPLLEQLPQGLDTLIGDGAGARQLSGGEAHRIALARAFLDGRRRVLIFDEPTAHLDIETELELKEHMLTLMQGRLVFFATHRLHWLANMDRVLVLAHGRVVADGEPRALAADGTIDRCLQAAEGDEADV